MDIVEQPGSRRVYPLGVYFPGRFVFVMLTRRVRCDRCRQFGNAFYFTHRGWLMCVRCMRFLRWGRH